MPTIRSDGPLKTVLEKTNRLVDPNWDRERPPAVRKVGDTYYGEYWYEKPSGGARRASQWWSLDQVNDLYYPIGLIGSKREWAMRFIGYIPIAGIVPAAQNLYHAIQMIFMRVIINKNSLTEQHEDIDHENRIILNTRLISPVRLSGKQRLAILGLALALLVRAVGEALCVGVLFGPLDIILNEYLSAYERHHHLSFSMKN